jgi:hypothetical protein
VLLNNCCGIRRTFARSPISMGIRYTVRTCTARFTVAVRRRRRAFTPGGRAPARQPAAALHGAPAQVRTTRSSSLPYGVTTREGTHMVEAAPAGPRYGTIKLSSGCHQQRHVRGARPALATFPA